MNAGGIEVRPHRAAIVFPAMPSRLRAAIYLASNLWGGRHTRLLPWDMGKSQFEIPVPHDYLGVDLLILVDLPPSERNTIRDRFYPTLRSVCIEYAPLTLMLRQLKRESIVTWQVPYEFWENRVRREAVHSVRHSDARIGQELSLTFDATFGIAVHEQAQAKLNGVCHDANSGSKSANLNLLRKGASKSTWLDVVGAGVRSEPRFRLPGLYCPTIVVIKNHCFDLSLFWNLRSFAGRQVFPLPAECIEGPHLIRILEAWAKSSPSGALGQRKLSLTSIGADDEVLERAVQALVPLASHEDPLFPEVTDARTAVGAGESNHYICLAKLRSETMRGGAAVAATFDPPFSLPLNLVAHFRRENGDGVKRGFRELALPRSAWCSLALSESASEGKVSYGSRVVVPMDTGIATEVRGDIGEATIRVPEPHELASYFFQSAGLTEIPDEKRPRYTHALRLFDGIHSAVVSFTGARGSVVAALLKRETVAHHALTTAWNQSREKDGSIARQKSPFRDLPPRLKKHALDRAQEAGSLDVPTLPAFINWLCGRAIVTRVANLGTCSRCMHVAWVSGRVDLNSPSCPVCQYSLPLPTQSTLRLGYQLSPAIRDAYNEGFLPVLMTLNALRNMSGEGFLSVPGVKVETPKGEAGDIDVFALSDGRVVFSECKDLRFARDLSGAETGLWEGIEASAIGLVRLGDRVGADEVVLSVLRMMPPPEVRTRIQQVSQGVHVRFLGPGDLGYDLLPSDLPSTSTSKRR